MTAPSLPAISWQYVALAALGVCFFLGIFVVIPADFPEARTALLGALGLIGNVIVTRAVTFRVRQVETKVNGNTTRLMDDLQAAHAENADLKSLLALETGTYVSRETSTPKKDEDHD